MAGKKLEKLIEKSVVAVHRNFNELVSKVRAFSSKLNAKTHKRKPKGPMKYAPLISSKEENEVYETDVASTSKTVHVQETTEEVHRIIQWRAHGPGDMLTMNNFERITKEPLKTTKCNGPSERTLVCEKGEGNLVIYKNILGAGGFGTVHKGVIQNRNQHNENISEIAVKAINYDQYIQMLPPSMVKKWETGFRSLLNNELGAMLLCAGHANIIQLKFVTITDFDVLCGLEYASKGDLLNYIAKNGRLPENQARRWFRDLAEALHYCHSKGIVHLDIKAENVLVDRNDNVKLTDFGLAIIAKNPRDPKEYEMIGSRRGTPACMAPEMRMGHVEDTRLCDAWNLAFVLFNMLTGFTDAFWEGGNNKYLFFQFVPAGAKTLVREALALNASKRLSLDNILRHPWVRGD